MLAEIDRTGTYAHTGDELAFGARLAWRNAARCIGRLYWRSLVVRDLRHVTSADDIAAACFAHLRLAYNDGRIRPVVSVFAPDRPGRPGPRIVNDQLVRYAGHRTAMRRPDRRPAQRAADRVRPRAGVEAGRGALPGAAADGA